MRSYRKFLVVAMVGLCGLLAVGQAGNFNQVAQCLLGMLLLQTICCDGGAQFYLELDAAFEVPQVSILPTETIDGFQSASFYYLEVNVTDLPVAHTYSILVESLIAADFDTDSIMNLGTGTETLAQFNDPPEDISRGHNTMHLDYNNDIVDYPFIEAPIQFDNDGEAVETDGALVASFMATDGNDDGIPYDNEEIEVFVDTDADTVQITAWGMYFNEGWIKELWLVLDPGGFNEEFISLGRVSFDFINNNPYPIFLSPVNIPTRNFGILWTAEPEGETAGTGLEDPFLPILFQER